MFIVKRKDGQAITIDDKIAIKILQAKRGHATIGVDAPTDIKITRNETMKDSSPCDGESHCHVDETNPKNKSAGH